MSQQCNKYILYQQQQREQGSTQPWRDVIPATYSLDGNGTETLYIGILNDTDDCCPSQAIENGAKVGDEIWRLVEGQYICQGTTKYQKWEAYEYNGTSWVSQELYKAGALIETESEDCGGGGIESMAKIVTSSGNTFIPCDAYRQITASQVPVTAITSIEIYECCETIANGVFSGATRLSSLTFDDESVIEINNAAFRGCTNLSSVTLPSTCQYVGAGAFSGCTNLRTAILPYEGVVTLQAQSTSLSFPYSTLLKVPCAYLTSYRERYGEQPWNFAAIENDCLIDTMLTFKSNSNNSRVHYNGTNYVEYSTDGGTTFTELQDGANLPLLDGDEIILHSYYGASDWGIDGGGNFVLEGDIEVYGNIMSLLDDGQFPWNFLNAFPNGTYDNGIFQGLFSGSTGLTSAHDLLLPAKQLSTNCYNGMFYGCTNLQTAPELPSTDLTNCNGCYKEMFYGCSSLLYPPALPATAICESCYHSMFNGCTNLQSAHAQLPATALYLNCYNAMYYNCSSITNCPELPAGGGEWNSVTNHLAESCYNRMFMGCSMIQHMPILPATILAARCYEAMFDGCVSLWDVKPLPALTLQERCYAQMFYGCTSLDTCPDMAPTYVNSGCCWSMFAGCTSLTTAMAELPATDMDVDNTANGTDCYHAMFSGCTSLQRAPDILATNIENGYLVSMFDGCSSLNYIKMMSHLALGSLTSTYSGNWVRGVASSGTFVKYSGISHARGVNGIPQNWTVQNA